MKRPLWAVEIMWLWIIHISYYVPFAEQWSTCWQLGVSRLEMTQQLKGNEYNSIIWPTSSAHVAFVQKGQKMCSWLIERTKVMTTMLSSMLRTFRKPMQIDTKTEHENRSLPTLWHMQDFKIAALNRWTHCTMLRNQQKLFPGATKKWCTWLRHAYCCHGFRLIKWLKSIIRQSCWKC